MSIAKQLEDAGVEVIQGRPGRGHPPTGLTFDVTGTGQGTSPADDINELMLADKAMMYVERDGRVWLLADGPLSPDTDGLCVFAAYRDLTDVQDELKQVLTDVVSDHYGLGDGDEL